MKVNDMAARPASRFLHVDDYAFTPTLDAHLAVNECLWGASAKGSGIIVVCLRRAHRVCDVVLRCLWRLLMLILLSMLLVILVKLLLWWLQSACLICTVRDRSVLLDILSLCAVLPPICVRSYCHTSQTPVTIATALIV